MGYVSCSCFCFVWLRVLCSCGFAVGFEIFAFLLLLCFGLCLVCLFVLGVVWDLGWLFGVVCFGLVCVFFFLLFILFRLCGELVGFLFVGVVYLLYRWVG